MRALSECGHRILIFLAHDPTSNSDTKKAFKIVLRVPGPRRNVTRSHHCSWRTKLKLSDFGIISWERGRYPART